MGHPEIKWSIVSSCCLHNRHLLSISSFKIVFLNNNNNNNNNNHCEETLKPRKSVHGPGVYTGTDKSLARPGRKQTNVSVRMALISFDALPCRKNNLMTAHVSMLLKSRASLTCFRTCFLPVRAKDLSAPRVYSSSIGTAAHCGLCPVEQCPSIFSYLPPSLSIFSLPTH